MQGGSSGGTDALRRGFWIVLCASALWLALPASARADSNCGFADGVLSVDFQPKTPFGSAGETIFSFADGELFSCAGEGPTNTNTDRIVVTDSSGGQHNRIRLQARGSSPLFAPGATDEGDGTSEIELDIDIGSGEGPRPDFRIFDTVGFDLGTGAHEVTIGATGGRTGLNLNAGAEGTRAPDIDALVSGLDRPARLRGGFFRGELLDLTAAGGDDRLLGNGGPLLQGPAQVSLLLKGRGGDNTLIGGARSDRLQSDSGKDRIKGGAGNDSIDAARGNDIIKGGPGKDEMDAGAGNDKLVGGPGKDELIAKGGRDVLKTRDGRRDKIDCGPGRDKVFADRKDRVKRSCERVKRR